MYRIVTIAAFLFMILILASCRKDEQPPRGSIQLSAVTAGTVTLKPGDTIPNVPIDGKLIITFSSPVDTSTVRSGIILNKPDNKPLQYSLSYLEDYSEIELTPHLQLEPSLQYSLIINSSLKGRNGESFGGVTFRFITRPGQLAISSIKLNGKEFSKTSRNYNIDYEDINIEITFSNQLKTSNYHSHFSISSFPAIKASLSSDQKTVTITNTANLKGYTRYYLNIDSDLVSEEGYSFPGYSNSFYTKVDSSLKFPQISDEQLLTLVQEKTFRYFYDYAHPVSGMTRERYGSGDIVTTGGSGFGIMALIVGMERNFITRNQGLERLDKVLGFLETCERHHGAWSHWINGSTGKTIPFSTKDNGGDLVETAFMIQGLLTMRQYLNAATPEEYDLIQRINNLYHSVEFDWYTRGGQNVLYWHWSPNYGWDMNFRLEGYNETLITYILAAASPAHTIPASAYHLGYARNGGIHNGKSFYGYTLPVGYDYGGPLFFAHYSFLGLDPRNLSDNYANYWTQNVNHSLINWAYCKSNPKQYPNYYAHCWGLTASDIPSGYGVSEPTNDRGVIAPTAAVSSLPYTPEQSMNAIRHFYYILGDKLWGEYGFYDAFDVTSSWWGNSYIAIDQGPQVCMIENHRTGLLWDLFMSSPEIQAGLTKLGFTY